MKIKYSFVTGETCEIEVDAELSTMIMTIEHECSLKDRAEMRRHTSIEALAEQGTEIADPTTDVFSWIEQEEQESRLKKAIAQLLPQQQELIRQVFFEGRTVVSIAADQKVSHVAIMDRLKRIYKILEKKLR